MTIGRIARRAALLLGAAALAGLFLATVPAEARVFVGVGVGVPVWPYPYYGYPYAYPYPYYPDPYAYPYPYYAPPAATATPSAPPPQTWYYCDSPAGYYPTVQSCEHAWRPVPATAPPAPR
jgi:hypothetical protein